MIHTKKEKKKKNNNYVNLHGYCNYGQDMHNFKQIDVSDFLGWLAKILP